MLWIQAFLFELFFLNWPKFRKVCPSLPAELSSLGGDSHIPLWFFEVRLQWQLQTDRAHKCQSFQVSAVMRSAVGGSTRIVQRQCCA